MSACRACHGKGMLLFANMTQDDVDWDICQRCNGEGQEPALLSKAGA